MKNALVVLKLLDVLLAAIGALSKLGVNYREVIDAQEQADAEGRELSPAELQNFVDEAQNEVDEL